MMTGMIGFRDTRAEMVAVMANDACLGVSASQGLNREVSVKKVLAAAMVVALVAVTLVGFAALVGVNGRGTGTADRQGTMPEVVVTAEMPRLVMPTVEVHAFRTVAMSPSVYNVN